jgi:hypothetical protein
MTSAREQARKIVEDMLFQLRARFDPKIKILDPVMYERLLDVVEDHVKDVLRDYRSRER